MQLRHVVELLVLWFCALIPNYVLHSIYSRFTLHWSLLTSHVHGNALKFHLTSVCQHVAQLPSLLSTWKSWSIWLSSNNYVLASCNSLSDYTHKTPNIFRVNAKAMQQISSSATESSHTSRNYNILRNLHFRYRFQNIPLLLPILSHMNPLHAHPAQSIKIHFNIVLPSTPRSSRQSSSCTLAHQVPVWTSIRHAPLILCPIYPSWSYYHKICSAEYKSLMLSLYTSCVILILPFSLIEIFCSAVSLLEYPQSRFFPRYEKTSLNPI